MKDQVTIIRLKTALCLPALLFFLCAQTIPIDMIAATKEKITLGEVEEVVLFADRSRMEYPLLIGFNVLVNDFLVDMSKSRLLSPACLERVPE